MNDDEIIQKKCFRLKRKMAAVVCAIFLAAGLATVFFLLKSSYHSDSDIVIMQAAAKQLNKDPNELTNDDFAQITQLNLSGKELSDIRLLEKFINLQGLYMSGVKVPNSALPKWKLILKKLHLINKSDNKFIDFKPLAKLTSLENLTLSYTEIDDIEPLSGLNNIRELNLTRTRISDFNPLIKFKNLESLCVSDTQFNDLKLIENLTNLQELSLGRSKVTDLKPIKKLKNLQVLSLSQNQVHELEQLTELKKLNKLYIWQPATSEMIGFLSGTGTYYTVSPTVSTNLDFESIKKMKKLEILSLTNFNLSREQQDDLHKANPDLKIDLWDIDP